MKTVFEVISQEILPCFRALVAKRLIENGFSQKQVADRLRLSQPAISQYKRDLRGQKTGIFVDYPQLLEETNTIAKRVATGEIGMDQATAEIFDLCKGLIETKE